MFILTAKVRRGRIVLGVLLLVIVCGTCTAVLSFHNPWRAEPTSAGLPSPKGVKSETDRIDFLSAYGWTVDPAAVTVEELCVPESFDASFDPYLQLQSQQGFDLKGCAGKTIKRYSYPIVNYPAEAEQPTAVLLLCKNTVVGGEVISGSSGEILHGLQNPTAATAPTRGDTPQTDASQTAA